MIGIPPFSWILTAFIDYSFFTNIIPVILVLGLAFYILFPPGLLPQGIFYQPKKGKSLKDIEGRLGSMLSNLPAPLIYVYAQFFYSNGNIRSYPSILFLMQCFYRCCVYPLFKKPECRRLPIRTLSFNMLSSFIHGILLGRIQAFSPPDMNLIATVVLVIIYLALGCALVLHDFIICRSRQPGQAAYQVLNVYLFKYITSPQYGLQLLQWVIFSSFSSDAFSHLAYVPFIGFQTLVRGDVKHGIFCGGIPGYQFLNRWPAIFGIRNSKFFIKI